MDGRFDTALPMWRPRHIEPRQCPLQQSRTLECLSPVPPFMAESWSARMPKDIDAIIAGVRRIIPEVKVDQLHKTHPPDDDGLWWFGLPGVREDIQIESSSYNCPFIIEHQSMTSSAEAMEGRTVEETILAVIAYLQPRRTG